MNEQETVTVTAPLRKTLHRCLLCVGIAGSLLFNFVYFTFGAIEPLYDMMRQPIRDLELMQHGWIQSANFMVFGLSVLIFAAALRNELESGFGINLLPLSHLFTGFGLILAGIFTREPEHTFVCVFAFVSLIISFVLFAIRFYGDPRWKGWTTYTLVSAGLMIVLLFMFGYIQSHDGPYAGVFERLVIVTRLVWIVIFIMKLLGGTKLAPVGVKGEG